MKAENSKTVVDSNEDISEYFLFPSTILVERNPMRVQTILGSCVAVCIYDVSLSFGGINHYMIPWWNGMGIPSPRYGDVAIDMMIKRMEALGSKKVNMIAKIFGGAHQHIQESATLSVGLRNVATAETILADNHIRIVSKSIGGTLGRKVLYDTGTGQVFMKFLQGGV